MVLTVRRILQLPDTLEPPVFTSKGKPKARHSLWVRLRLGFASQLLLRDPRLGRFHRHDGKLG